MHEMSLVQNIVDIARQEMASHGLTRLKSVKIACGKLSGVVPDALHMAFRSLTAQTDLEGAGLELEMVPVRLCCAQCGHTFCAQNDEPAFLAAFVPCPECGQEVGHRVLAGQELNIEYIEAE